MPDNSSDPFGSINISRDDDTKDTAREADVPIEPDLPEEEGVKKEVAPETRKTPAPPTGPDRRKKSTSLTRKLIILGLVVVNLFLLYSLAGFLGVPYLCKTVFPDRFSERFDRPMTVGAARFNPYTLELVLQNTIIGPRLSRPDDRIDPLCSLSLLEADLSWTSLFRGQLHGSRLLVDGFFFHLERDLDKNYNIFEILPRGTVNGIPVVDLPFSYVLANVNLTNGRLLFDDLPADKRHMVEHINLALPVLYHNVAGKGGTKPFFTGADQYINPRFSATINGSPIDLTGETKVGEEGFEAQLQLHLEEIDLPGYLAYLPGKSRFEVDKGTGDIVLFVTFLSRSDQNPMLEVETLAKLKDVRVHDKDNRVSKISRASLSGTILPLDDVYRFDDITLQEAELHVERNSRGEWVLPGIPLPDGQEKDSPEGADFTVRRLTIVKSTLGFTDQRVDGGFAETVSDLDLTVTSLTAGKEGQADFVMKGRTSGETTVNLSGKLSLSPLRLEGNLTAADLQLKTLSPYYTFSPGFMITRGVVGRLDGNIHLSFDRQGQVKDFSFADLEGEITDFDFSHHTESWLSFPAAGFKVDTIAHPARRLDNLVLTVEKPRIALKWDREHRSNWHQVFATPAEAKSPAPPWQVAITTLEGKDAELDIENLNLPSPLRLTLSGAQISASNLSTIPKSEGTLSLSLPRLGKGSLTLNGPLTLKPYAAELTCILKDYDLETTPSLVHDWFHLPRVQGILQAKGRITLPGFTYNGSLELEDFIAATAQGEELLRCGQAEADQLDFTYEPPSLAINELGVHEAYLRLVLPFRQELDLDNLFGVKTAGKAASDRGKVRIDTVTLEKVLVDFSDKRPTPQFNDQKTFAGTLTNLVNEPGNRMGIEVSTTPPAKAPVTFSGSLGMFDPDLFADITATFADQDITPFSPYLSSLFNYGIKDGRFTLTSRYRQEKDRITAKNNLAVTDLELGKSGSRSSQLPLTIALFSRGNDRIELDFDFKGNASDSSYTFAGALGRVLRNLVLKTTVSPFSQLTSSFPELARHPEHVLFQPGGAELTEATKNYLALLARVLTARPLLTLDIKGFASEDTDRQALLQAKEEKLQLKRQLQQQSATQELSQMYGDEEISGVPVQERPFLFPGRDEIAVTRQELSQLARERATVVFDYLQDPLKIDRSRLTTDQNGTVIGARAPGLPGNRVDFILGAKIPASLKRKQ